MAKDKSGVAKKDAKAERKAERKAEKQARKAEKVSKKQAAAAAKAGGAGPTGVTKTKGENKEKKAARKALAEKALNELQDKGNKKKTDVEDEDEESGDEEDDEMEEQNGVKVDEDEGDDEDEQQEEESKKATDSEKKILAARPVGALVPFANPLADDKVARKVFKCVKKAASQRTLRRGVKEVVKALRKSPTSSTEKLPLGVVVLAADISPMDVISHIPVLAEDHSVPYIYVTSRAELGTAGQTKRPTSVVMVSRDAGKKGGKDGKEKEKKIDEDGDDKESWEDTYKSLVKAVEREGRHVKI
ncbi:uncharacterized protein PV07_08555 [Cladophialophora immunda]|uniref:Ribosomal protein eL8/eL30/eS12/Gadd45 domain-containing protein n=1 Tax=Cladophialophora immunda TaxID=569365 RepID=A0A0D2AK94_9EURO|nr:uncharacterized protein PV07_08555 [Cladophialophora immunda]KIW25372.1 hypothetical protein PV07_08555 [Cladophialophora immunda]